MVEEYICLFILLSLHNYQIKTLSHSGLCRPTALRLTHGSRYNSGDVVLTSLRVMGHSSVFRN